MPWQPDNNAESAQRASEKAELAAILDELESNDCYKVARTLRGTPQESTQVVFRSDGAGPFIRKTFASDSNRGLAYAGIIKAQEMGISFKHQPYVHEFSKEAGEITVIMECISGKTLSQLVSRIGPSPSLAARMGIQLCDAMSELHDGFSPSMIHRDIKPSNIMISDNRLILIDLGIARNIREEAQRDTVRFGTPGYAPPEQFGYGQTNIQSDIYAAGMVMAFCLLGQDCPAAIRDSRFQDERIPLELREILIKATAFDPQNRFHDAQEMKAAILQACDPQRPITKASVVTRSRNSKATKIASFYARKGSKPTLAWLGIIWNLIVFLAWVIMMYGCFGAMLYDTEHLASYPMWFRIVGLTLAGIVPSTLIAYSLLDKRLVRHRIPPIANLGWYQELPFCVVFSILSIIAMVSIGIISGVA